LYSVQPYTTAANTPIVVDQSRMERRNERHRRGAASAVGASAIAHCRGSGVGLRAGLGLRRVELSTLLPGRNVALDYKALKSSRVECVLPSDGLHPRDDRDDHVSEKAISKFLKVEE
jgi:hypothetical protein